MDTVSMLDKMRFYCQPILPLVYDESMSYYETLCKVVGQLNTTGDTVNKLNEGLTGEISDRQAADAELDERLKLIESTNAKTHFLVFDGANPNGFFPTRHELYQWVEAGDAIFTLLRTYEEGRGQIDAASCSYNAGNWGSEASNDFSIIVPIETSYDATRDYAVKQKVAKLTIPPIPQTNLNAPWGLQIIEVNTPSTSADGVVNLVAVINDSDSVNCSITPSEFLGLYNMTRGGKNLCVAVNAKLAYDGLARSSSVATVDTTNRKIRIAFERDYGTFIENGVKQLNKTLDYIIGDASTNVWTHETIDSKTLNFSRYEGFQFTRGAHNVITANDESTPNAVWAQYQSDHSGKIYQNLPVRLIDTVDNAEYWNGVFDIKDGKHMTFSFVTSNYATASDKMLVRVIELSADVNTTTWKYAEKEFELPLNVSNGVVTYTASKVGEGEYKAAAHKTEYQVDFAEGVPAIIASIEAGNRVILRADLKESGSELGATPLYFASGYTRVDIFSNAISYVFSGSISNGHYTLELNSGLAHATLTTYGEVLPEPNPDGTDNGKVPIVNGNKWELQLPTYANGNVDDALSDTSTNPVQNKVVKAALDSKLSTLGGEISGDLDVGLTVGAGGSVSTGVTKSDSGIHFEKAASDAGRISHGMAAVDDTVPLARLKVAAPTEDDDAATKAYVDNNAGAGAVRYDAAQTLDEVQQGQARRNIGAVGHDSPQFQGYLTLTPANAPIGTGVGLSPSRDGNNFALNISDVNEDTPTLLTGVKTPTDTDTNAAATVEYVKNKVADGGSSDAVLYTEQTLTDAQKKQARDNIYAAIADFVVNGTVNSNPETGDNEVTLDKTFAQIQAAIQEGKHPAVHVTYEERNIALLPLVAYSTNGVAFAAVADVVSEGNITSIGLAITPNDDIHYDISTSPALNSDGDLIQFPMASDPIAPMEIATKKYVDNHPGGAPITIKLVTGNAATSTATFAEIKAALEAGKAPILDSAPGTSHWFALNWVLYGTDILTIQYGTFNVDGGGMANFTVYDVSVSTTVITYSSRKFTTE